MTQGQAVKKSIPSSRLGVFLCECGPRIAAKIDLAALAQMLHEGPGVGHVETLPFPCLTPGLDRIKQAVAAKRLNRVIVAGCESRILQKKFEQALEPLGVGEGQIDLVNLRDHVAQVHSGKPADLAGKGAKLIGASQAWLQTLEPAPGIRIDFKGPVMVLGDGVAGYGAAQELAGLGIATMIALLRDPEEEIQRAHSIYPGDDHCFDRLGRIIQGVAADPLIQKVRTGELREVSGRFGDYTVTFSPRRGRRGRKVWSSKPGPSSRPWTGRSPINSRSSATTGIGSFARSR